MFGMNRYSLNVKKLYLTRPSQSRYAFSQVMQIISPDNDDLRPSNKKAGVKYCIVILDFP